MDFTSIKEIGLHKLSKSELLYLLNNLDLTTSNASFKRLLVCTYIVNKSKNIFYLTDNDILSSAIVSIFYSSLLNNKMTLSEVNTIIDNEVGIVNNSVVFSVNNNFNQLDALVSGDDGNNIENNLLIKLIKDTFINLCPVEYRLIICLLLETGELYYDNYSLEDKMFIDLFLRSFGFTMENRINIEILKEINTIPRRIMFFNSLKNINNSVFLLLATLKDVNATLMFLESFSGDGAMRLSTAIDNIETACKIAIKATDINAILSKEETELVRLITNDIVLDVVKVKTFNDVLWGAIGDMNNLYYKEVENEVERSRYSGNSLKVIANQLKNELTDTTGMLKKLIT